MGLAWSEAASITTRPRASAALLRIARVVLISNMLRSIELHSLERALAASHLILAQLLMMLHQVGRAVVQRRALLIERNQTTLAEVVLLLERMLNASLQEVVGVGRMQDLLTARQHMLLIEISTLQLGHFQLVEVTIRLLELWCHVAAQGSLSAQL